MAGGRRIQVGSRDVLVYNKIEIDTHVLDAVLSTDKRLLWAFLKDEDGNVMAVPYNEERVIWLTEADIHQPNEVEI